MEKFISKLILFKNISSYHIIILVTVLAFILNFRMGMKGIQHPITELHSFRQTQTAISTFYMVRDGLTYDYVTPVLGSPWKIPFEFPTYQLTVAFFTKILKSPLDITGRIVSLCIFYLLVLFIIFYPTQLFNNTTKFIIAFFLLIHPIYIFWSRTFMIESTALLLSIIYLFSGIAFFEKRNKGAYVIFFLAGTMASLSKVTTFAIATLCLGFYILFSLFEPKEKYSKIQNLVLLGLTLVFIFVVVKVWVNYTDRWKELSILGERYSSKNLHEWNFGTIEARFNFENWLRFVKNSSYTFLLALILLVCGLFTKSSITFWSFLLAGILGPIIFFNLYKVHNYYHYANTIYILIALALFINKHENMFLFLSAFCFVLFFSIYKSQYLDYQYEKVENPVLIGRECKKITDLDDNILVVGDGWNSEIPYYSERKSICFTNETIDSIKQNSMVFLNKLNAKNVKVLVLVKSSLCDTSKSYVDDIAKHYDLDHKTVKLKMGACFYYK